ncbi:MAG: phytoene desaturase family protein [Trueperaceae bacterium]
MSGASAMHVDAVVVGAGVAGATAAALLAAEGRRVVVLERDAHAGGCAASFDDRGFSFAVGATVGMGLEEGGVLRRVYDRVGLTPRFAPVDPAIRVFVGDRTIDLHADRAAWAAEIARAFPGEDAAKRRFWSEVAVLARGLAHASKRFPVLPLRTFDDVVDTARAAHPALVPVALRLRATVADLLRRHGVTDPVHRAFVDGQLVDAMQTTADDCAAPNGALALDVYRYGAQYVPGGLASIADDLLASVVQRGGEVRLKTRARRLLVDAAGRVAGVATRAGDLRAPVVVSAVPLANTAELLGATVPTRLHPRAEAQRGHQWGAFTLYLGVDERGLPSDVRPFLQVTGVPEAGEPTPVHDGGNLLISVSPAWDRARAPEGKRAITVSTHVDASRWMALAADPQSYAAAKAAFTERLLDRVEVALPRVRDGIEVLHAGTPRTFHRYTRRADGAVGGLPQTLAHANFAAPSHRTDVPGLFLAGDTVFPGQGTLGVAISGFVAARSAARFLARSRSAPMRHAPIAPLPEAADGGSRVPPIPQPPRGPRRSAPTQEVSA